MRYPLTFCLWLMVLIGTATYAFLFWKEYQYHKSHREHKREPILKFFEENCRDPSKIIKFDLVDLCHERSHIIQQEPSEYALYDVLESRGWCFGYNCEHTFSSSSLMDPLKMITCLFIIVFIMLFMCGGYLSRLVAHNYYTSGYLPTTSVPTTTKKVQ